MNALDRETIFAVASGSGRAAITVIRLSGPATRTTLLALTGASPVPRRASLRTLRRPGGEALDESLVIWFPGPRSFTGEDAGELHVHGGLAVVEAVLTDLGERPCHRAAEPGEFTRRAFENGKLDLTQAEAVADLVDAETEAQRLQALEQLGGALSQVHQGWRSLLLEAAGHLEAAVDFPDEDLPDTILAQVRRSLLTLQGELSVALADADRGRRVRDGFRIALLGAPNVGKSTLLNALSHRDAAIVTPIAGTTRDIIEVPVIWAGHRVILADTAGLRDTDDVVEAEGVRRARSWALEADLRLWISDAASTTRDTAVGCADLNVINKVDLVDATELVVGANTLTVAAIDSSSVDALRASLRAIVRDRLSGSRFPSATRLRHIERLTSSRDELTLALQRLAVPELASEHLRRSTRSLAEITGEVGVEDVLQAVFSTFCIGK